MRSFSSDSDGSGAAGGPAQDLFVTETMAELSARQGRTADAIAIYRRLLAGGAAGDRLDRWERRLAALEGTAVSGLPAASARTQPAKSLPGLSVPPSASASAPAWASPSPAPAAPAPQGPLLIEQPVRSGQIVYAQGRDLVVLAPVNPGAQLMADGHIHVYGPLRGRAVAGVRGWPRAQVFCQRLEAELVGVDAAYLAADDLPVDLLGKPARIWLAEGVCRVGRLPGS
jgi:septum site-determining protein MinC